MNSTIKQSLAAALALAATVGTGLALAAQTNLDLPDLGQPADRVLSPAQETAIGNEIVQELYLAEYVVDDPEVADYLSHLGWRLAAAGTHNPPNFRFYLLPDPDINAASFPGAVIVINVGTLLVATSESELAAVMAHEEAHTTQRHIAREGNDTENGNIATWAGMLAAIIAGAASGNSNVVLGALAIGQGINEQRAVSYTRVNEMEADRIGIRTLANAGFNPASMADFFQRLEQQTRLYGHQLPEILQTHPVNTTRIAEATERAATYPKRNYVDSVDFAFMRARARVLVAQVPSQAADFFRNRIGGEGAAPADRYGYALSLGQLGRDGEALDALAPVVAQYPKLLYPNLLRASLLMDSQHTAEALAIFAKMRELYPNSPSAILESAQALLDGGKPEQARQILLDGETVLGNYVDRFRLLSQAASAMGNTAEAQYQMGNYQFTRGDVRGAVEQIDAALRLSSLTPDDRARLLARRREFIASVQRT